MTRVKICGLSRPCDIEYVNELLPDYCGFIINVERSHRSVSPERVRGLAGGLSPAVVPVGVFVNEPIETILALLRDGAIAAAQLHGQESEEYIKTLKEDTDAPIIKAFRVETQRDLALAEASSADLVLLDNGAGGTGESFNWRLIGNNITRPYFLAGGLNAQNVAAAIEEHRPFAADFSSGVETDKLKDFEKIRAAIAAVRRCEI